MEKLPYNGRKYNNYRFDKYNHNSVKEGNENEFDLINKDTYESQRAKKFTNIQKKENPNSSQQDKIFLTKSKDNITNNNKNNRRLIYNSINQNCFDNNDNNYSQNNNRRNAYRTQVVSSNRSPNNANPDKDININNNNKPINKKNSHNFSNLAKTLKYFNNKISFNNNNNNFFYDIYYDTNSGKKLKANKNISKNDYSSDKISLNLEDKNLYNLLKNGNFRNFDIQTNNNQKKIKTLIGSVGSKNNSIWSNINKELLPKEIDLQNNFLYNEEENKSKTPLKLNERYFKNGLKSSTIEKNVLGDKKKGLDYRNKENLNQNERKSNIKTKEVKKDNDNDNEGKDLIPKMKIKNTNVNMQYSQESSDRNTLKKYNSNNNTNLKKSFDKDNSKRNYVNQNNNKIMINKGENQTKNNNEHTFLNKNNKFTKSSPNILKQFQPLNIKNLNLKSPISYKEISIFNSTLSKSGKIASRNNASLECSFENYPSLKNLNNIHVNLINQSSPKNSGKKSVPRTSINLNGNRNKYIKQNEKEKEKEINNTNVNQNQNQNMLLNKNQLKPILSQNNIKKTKSNANTGNNNSKIIISGNNNIGNNNTSNNKNQYYMKQNSKIIFQKKVNRSPMGFNKKLNMYKSNNNELSENAGSILKVEDNSSANLKKSMNENRFKIDKNIYNYNFVNNNNNNVSQDIEIINKIKNIKINNSIDSYKNTNVSSGINKKIYIRQKPQKKLEQPKYVTQGKLDTKKLNQMRFEEKYNNDLYNNDYIDYYPMENIKNKINIKKKNLITKYYDYFINYPKLENCSYSKAFFKIMKIPEIEICHISKINLPICKIYKTKSVCYYSKIRVIGGVIINPPINDNCEFSKNIIFNPKDHKTKKIKEAEIDKLNNQQNALPKKNKKRKKRRKTRALLKGKENNKNENKSKNNENDNDNDNELDNNLDYNENGNDNDNENDDNKRIENEELNEEKEQNKNMKKEINVINNINNANSPYLEGNNKNLRKIIINNRSPKYKSSNDERSGGISEREVVFTDIEKNCPLKSPTIYNDDDFNDEENDDFRIESDEEEEISNDKYKKKDNDKEYKTEGKEIPGDYKRNKMTKEQKTTKGLKILEKLQGKRNSVEYDHLNNLFFNKEMGEYNDNENMYTDDDYNYNKEGNNKKIALATNKLSEIFNNQKNYGYNDEGNEEIENEDNNDNYSNDYTENKNVQNRHNINYNIYRKKNNTYKKKINYERIGTIFDRLEGIIDKKKTNKKLSIIEINNENAENEKCKTPLVKMGDNIKNRINEFKFDLKEDNNCYIYNDDNNNENNENENYYNNTDNNNNNENENEEESEERKDNYLKKDMDMNKYKEIFNKQQIISKLESLMNKPKKEYNININFDENIFNSPKIESEIDTDMNANKDTPGNRKEMKKNYLLQCQNKRMYTFEEIISYKNKKLCLNNNLLPLEVIKHCHEISNNIEHKDSFKANYKDIVMNSNNYVYNRRNSNNNLEKKEKESSMSQWARKDMTKEIEEAEKYVKELNSKMSKDNYKHKIIEVLNTLTVDNYKNILNKMIEMLYLSENPRNNKVELNKPEYLLHNQFIFVEIILDKATIEKGYVVLYAKLCANLFIELIKLIKQYNNPEIGNQLINGENLKTILTNQCRQRFDECISISSLSEKANDYDKKEIFLIFKKKFLGNMDFIAELINVKILSQTKGFEFLEILYKRYKEIKNNNKIKFLNLEGAVTLLTKFGRIIMNRKNPKHMQNLDNYINDNLYPIISYSKIKNNDNDNEGLPNYLKFKIINLIEKKKNNWKDSLYEQSIVAKGKNNNISISHDLTDSNINIDESLLDNQKIMNNTNKEKEEDRIMILLKNDIENYVSFLSEHNVTNKQELNEYNNQNENSDINNEYDWTISEELIIKTKNELEEIIRCYIEVCIDYVTKEKNIFFCNEYIKNIVNYYSLDLTKDELEKIRISMNDLYLNIEDICIDNYFMLEVMGYLLLILLNNNLFYIEDLNKFISEDKERINKISQVIKFTIAHSEDKYKELYNNFRKIELYNGNKDIFEEYIEKPLKNNYEMNFE